MPRMDGLEALRLLREIRPDIPVVLTSGYGEQEIASRLAEQSFAGFIQKPYRLPALERTLRTVFSDR
jgi:CheY-like chemotaxis protein